MRVDRAFALGVSGGNGWQRLFEGTRLQCFFDKKPERGYDLVMQSSEDGFSGRTSSENEHREDDLESAWVQDLGATWKVKDPAESVS